jgi:ribosome-binding ATPase YchF (GTP1/OBG family)
MQVGIVGAPMSGRTTVFSALLAHRTHAQRAQGARAERGTSAGIGQIQVRDPRLDRLAAWFHPEKVTPIELELHDLCSSLEPTFPTSEVEAMKRMDVLLVVAPLFVERDAAAALDRLLAEFWLEDLAAIERRLKRAQRERIEALEQSALLKAQSALESERPVRSAPLSELERRAIRGYSFVSDRPWIVVCNQAEADAGKPAPTALVHRAAELGAPALALCASLEAEMASLPTEDREAFLSEYGVQEPAGAALTRAVLESGQVIPFFTVGEDECRAWPIPRGTLARGAAGQIHSDIERGFIRAEVIAYDDLAPLGGSLAEARKLGKLRLESKEYVVQDGDVIHFRFNV